MKLSEEHKEKLDASLTEEELGKSKDKLLNRKSPDVNGKEFIDIFWTDIKDIFMDFFNEILTKEQLLNTESKRRRSNGNEKLYTNVVIEY